MTEYGDVLGKARSIADRRESGLVIVISTRPTGGADGAVLGRVDSADQAKQFIAEIVYILGRLSRDTGAVHPTVELTEP